MVNVSLIKEVKPHFLLQAQDIRVLLCQLLQFVLGQVCFLAFPAFDDFCADLNGVIPELFMQHTEQRRFIVVDQVFLDGIVKRQKDGVVR